MSDTDEFGHSHPIERKELLTAKLKELENEVAKIKQRNALQEAEMKCPDQVEMFKLGFLRCGVFCADAAAKRMATNWDKRLEFFEPALVFQPPAQDGLFQGIEHATALGFFTLLHGVQDPAGQGVILIDPSKQDFSKVYRMDIIKAVWYCIHASSEQEPTQKNGAIGLICPRNAKLSQHDKSFDCFLHGSVQGILPVWISCIVFCRAPFLHILWPIIRLVLSQRFRKRVRALAGKDEVVLGEFQAMGFCKGKVPELIGGNLRVDHQAWMEGRHLVEN